MSRLIDADAIKEKIDDIWDGRPLSFLGARILAMIDEAPTIDADRPQGEWIDAEIPLESGGSMPIQVCNLCKAFYPLAYTGGGHRFCPNCGARMKGADDNRDYERAAEQREYDMLYESTYNLEDGSM